MEFSCGSLIRLLDCKFKELSTDLKTCIIVFNKSGKSLGAVSKHLHGIVLSLQQWRRKQVRVKSRVNWKSSSEGWVIRASRLFWSNKSMWGSQEISLNCIDSVKSDFKMLVINGYQKLLPEPNTRIAVSNLWPRGFGDIFIEFHTLHERIKRAVGISGTQKGYNDLMYLYVNWVNVLSFKWNRRDRLN